MIRYRYRYRYVGSIERDVPYVFYLVISDGELEWNVDTVQYSTVQYSLPEFTSASTHTHQQVEV